MVNLSNQYIGLSYPTLKPFFIFIMVATKILRIYENDQTFIDIEHKISNDGIFIESKDNNFFTELNINECKSLYKFLKKVLKDCNEIS